MISATGRSGGFSILEVLLVLAIIVLFSGYFMLRFDDSRAEQVLAQISADLKGAALKAKKRSYAFRRDQYLVFSGNAFWTTENPPRQEEILLPEPGAAFDRFTFPSDVLVEYRPPGTGRWQKLPAYVWTFRESGLSEPLSVRFTTGRSYTAMHFNALTGLAEEETFLE